MDNQLKYGPDNESKRRKCL